MGSQEKRVRDKRRVSDGEVQRLKQWLLKMVRRRRLSEGEEGRQRRKRSVRKGGKGRRQSERTERKKRATKKTKQSCGHFHKKKPPDGTMPAILCHKGLQACTPYAREGSGQKRCGNNDTSRRV